ncbi:MAG: hypothetical protein LBC72_05565, partial [Spirochaetaceae bacterium]|nr:hypothetical protein [Spirochaetaceae bacterium]
MKKKVFWKLAGLGLAALVFTAAGCRKVTDPPTSAPEDEIPVVKVSVNITPAAAAAHVTVK